MSQGWQQRSIAPSAGSPAAPPATPPRRSESAGRPPPGQKTICSSPLAPEVVEGGDINGVEAFADPEQEDADDDERDQDREGHTDLDHERHAFGAGSRQHQSVLERHETHDL